MKILVLGFSVTAESGGFVEIAAPTLAQRYGAVVTKCGLGGLQPTHARYIFPKIIRDTRPDLVIIDHATPGFRKFYSDAADYRRTLLNLLRLCREMKSRVAMIDFPRTDVDYAADWVTKSHADLCARFGIPHLAVPRSPGHLRDEVHPTEAGRKAYAETMIEACEKAAPVTCTDDAFRGSRTYDAIEFASLMDNPRVQDFSRGGLRVRLVKIAQDETVCAKLNAPAGIAGFSTLMGPTTGEVDMTVGSFSRKQISYDQFCYYERLGAFLIGPAVHTADISIRQTDHIPKIALLKGEKNMAPRIGAIGHVFLERDFDPEDDGFTVA